MRLVIVNDDVPPETTELLRASCVARDVEVVEVHAPNFLFDPDSQLIPGDMMYRPAVSLAAIKVEQFLYADAVSTFYVDDRAVFSGCLNSILCFQRAGIPVPRAIPISSGDRSLLRHQVSAVGGLPTILKVPGGAGGIGTIQIDSLAGLFSTVDFMLARGEQLLLCAFIPEAVHWRIIVIGDQAVGYQNELDEDDFRTSASTEAQSYSTTPPPHLVKLARDAVASLGLEFGGVDILVHNSGRAYVLEANFPCYFAHPQLCAGIDVSGMMLDHLIAKKRRLSMLGT